MASQKKKVTLYFNAGMLAETQKEALRQDRSISWIIQAAWKIARDEVRRMPTALSAGANAAAAANAAPASASASVAAAASKSSELAGRSALSRPV